MHPNPLQCCLSRKCKHRKRLRSLQVRTPPAETPSSRDLWLSSHEDAQLSAPRGQDRLPEAPPPTPRCLSRVRLAHPSLHPASVGPLSLSPLLHAEPVAGAGLPQVSCISCPWRRHLGASDGRARSPGAEAGGGVAAGPWGAGRPRNITAPPGEQAARARVSSGECQGVRRRRARGVNAGCLGAAAGGDTGGHRPGPRFLAHVASPGALPPEEFTGTRRQDAVLGPRSPPGNSAAEPGQGSSQPRGALAAPGGPGCHVDASEDLGAARSPGACRPSPDTGSTQARCPSDQQTVPTKGAALSHCKSWVRTAV